MDRMSHTLSIYIPLQNHIIVKCEMVDRIFRTNVLNAKLRKLSETNEIESERWETDAPLSLEMK